VFCETLLVGGHGVDDFALTMSSQRAIFARAFG
jgi:hypothetical protein